VGLLDWEKLTSAFLDRFFPLEMREAKVLEFINLRQGNMIVNKYALKFMQLSKYSTFMVADYWENMRKFVLGMSKMVIK